MGRHPAVVPELDRTRTARMTLRVWQPSSLSGLLQTEPYAPALLRMFPGATDEQVAERLAARLARQVILARRSRRADGMVPGR